MDFVIQNGLNETTQLRYLREVARQGRILCRAEALHTRAGGQQAYSLLEQSLTCKYSSDWQSLKGILNQQAV